MVSNNNEYQKKYMKQYVLNSKKIHCDICAGTYKQVYKYRHLQSKKHNIFIDFKKSFVII
jgi:hypothetical protein